MATTLTFGKYEGKTLEQVAKIDQGYIEWVMVTLTGEDEDGIDWSDLASECYDMPADEDEDEEVCPICHKTSCAGPADHSNRPYGGRR